MDKQPETKFVVPDYTTRTPDCLTTDVWDEYPELRRRAVIMFHEQQAEKEAFRRRELPVVSRVCFRVARFLSRYIH